MNQDLTRMLRSPVERDFREGFEVLRRGPLVETVRILEELRTDSDANLRCRALEGLVQVSPDRGESIAILMLSDSDPTVRWWAVYHLTIMSAREGTSTRTAVQPLVHILQTDPDELVRSLAASALGEIGNSSALPVLQESAAHDEGKDHEGQRISEIARVSIQKIMQRMASAVD